MPFYRVPKTGTVGYVDTRDLRAHELPPEGWCCVDNARMMNGRVQSVLPWSLDVALAEPDMHALDYYQSVAGDQHLYVYTPSNIYSVDNAGNKVDVGKVGLVGDPYPTNIWVTDQLNNIPLATNNRDAPQCFYNNGNPITPATKSQDFPDWGPGGTYENAQCRIVRSYKNFLVALNINDVSLFPNMVAWSDAAEPNLMPATWDYTNPAKLAGRAVLGTASGPIVAAEVLRDSLFIYCEYETWRMDFVGGQFVMRFTRVFSNQGAYGPRAVGNFGGRHFVLTRSDVIVHDGQQQRSVGDMRVRNRIFEGLEEGDSNRVWVAPFLTFSEMWIGVPNSLSNKAIEKAIVWQWDENVWANRNLPDTRYMKDLPTLNPDDVVDTWNDGLDVSWNDGPDNIWNQGGELGDLRPRITSTDGSLYYADAGIQFEDTVLRRLDISLGGDENNAMAVAVYPRVEGEEPIQIRMGVQNTIAGSLIWDRYVTFDPKTQYNATMRAMGKRHAIEFVGKNFELESYDIEWQPAGRR